MLLVDRIRAARERDVEVGGYKFRLRRPTGLRIARDGADATALLRNALVGWDIAAHQVWPGGGPERAPWEIDAAIEWLEDRPPLYNGLLDALNGMIDEYIATLKDTEKK